MSATTGDDAPQHDDSELRNLIESLKPDNWAWDVKAAKSVSPYDVQFSNAEKTVLFHPTYAFGTAAAFGQRALDAHSIAYWEVKISHVYGTSMMVGIGKRQAKTHSPTEFEHILGATPHSMGLAHNGFLYMAGHKPQQYCSPMPQDREVTVGVLFNGNEQSLAYFVNGIFSGVAFKGINIGAKDKFYPMASSTAQKSEFTLAEQRWSHLPRPLTYVCINAIGRSAKGSMSKVIELGLPIHLKKRVCDYIEQTQFHSRCNLLGSRVKSSMKAADRNSSKCSTAKKKRRTVRSTVIQEHQPEGEYNISRTDFTRLLLSGQRQLQSMIVSGVPQKLDEQSILKQTKV
ncbi:SPRY domain-containing protein [Ditylenchus destructor]|uniref:SPRY domain-containing protein n=1 Tax=Ditylenchus destructor TaxID=166010 RepID=A0AAD4N858_9BILA|nr:SPRY domain-containing protein [Ditylenchus destructor]